MLLKNLYRSRKLVIVSYSLSILWLLFSANTFAQLQVVPHILSPSSDSHAKRVKTAEAMPLPFWDDFSFVGREGDTLWASKASVRMADGFAINPPSLGVAIFDGLNASGLPYSADLTAIGFSDSLVSRKIKLGDVPTEQRDSVYLSFAYQWKGNGEAPDASDYLQVNFLNDQGTWVSMDIIRLASNADPAAFENFIIKIDNAIYFHNDFQFLITRYGRLSGSFDTWAVDYVYLNQYRYANDLAFPDRTLSTGLTSLFGDYYAVPKVHLDANRNVVTAPRFGLRTLQVDPTVQGTSISETTTLLINSYSSGVLTETESVLDNAVGYFLEPFNDYEVDLQVLPDLNNNSLFNFSADSIKLHLVTSLKSSDNLFDRYPDGHPLAHLDSVGADYDSTTFYPIDFRNNDTTSRTYWIKDFYAYDDGKAENTVVIVQTGDRAAFQFTQLGSDSDTLTGVYIYFPVLTGTLSNLITLQIYDDAGGAPGSLLGEETGTVVRSGANIFHRIKFQNAVVVSKEYYIGWEQPTSKLGIGVDFSIDHNYRLFENSSGAWQNPSGIPGTLMIRPIFGKGDITTSVEGSMPTVSIYPNPVHQHFTINRSVHQLQLFSSSGSPILFQSNIEEGKTNVTLQQPYSGIAIVRMLVGTTFLTRKIIVR